MARGAKNARQEDKFLNEIISLFVLNARKSKNALNAKIIEVIPNEISIAFFTQTESPKSTSQKYHGY